MDSNDSCQDMFMNLECMTCPSCVSLQRKIEIYVQNYQLLKQKMMDTNEMLKLSENLRAQNKSLSLELKEKQSHSDELSRQLTEALTSLEPARLEKVKLETRYNSVSEKLTKLSAEHASVVEVNKQMKFHFSEIESQLLKTNTQVKQQQERIKELDSKLRRNTDDMERQHASVRELKKKNLSLSHENARLENEVKRFVAAVSRGGVAVRGLRRRRRQSTVHLTDAEYISSELELSPSHGFLLTPLSSPVSPIASLSPTDSEDADEVSDGSVDEIAHILETELQPALSAPSVPSCHTEPSSHSSHFETQNVVVTLDLQCQPSPENHMENPDIEVSSPSDSVARDAEEMELLKATAVTVSSLSKAETYPTSSEVVTSQSLLPSEAQTCLFSLEPVMCTTQSEAAASVSEAVSSEAITCQSVSEAVTSSGTSKAKTSFVLSEADCSASSAVCQLNSKAVTCSVPSEAATCAAPLEGMTCSSPLEALTSVESEAPTSLAPPETATQSTSEITLCVSSGDMLCFTSPRAVQVTHLPSEIEAVPEPVKEEPYTSSDVMTSLLQMSESSATEAAVDTVLLNEPCTVPSDAFTNPAVPETEQDRCCTVSSGPAISSVVKLERPEIEISAPRIPCTVPCDFSEYLSVKLELTAKTEVPSSVTGQQDTGGRKLQVTETLDECVSEPVTIKSQSTESQSVITTAEIQNSVGLANRCVKYEAGQLDAVMLLLQDSELAAVSQSSETPVCGILTTTAPRMSNTLTSVTSGPNTVTPVSSTVTSVSSTVTSVSSTMTPLSSTVSSVSSTVTSVSSTVTLVSSTVTSVSSTVTPVSSTVTSVSSTVTLGSSIVHCTVTCMPSTVACESTTISPVSVIKVCDTSTSIVQMSKSLDYTAAVACGKVVLPLVDGCEAAHHTSVVRAAGVAGDNIPSSPHHMSACHATCSSRACETSGSRDPAMSINDSMSEDELHIVLQDDSFTASESAAGDRSHVCLPTENSPVVGQRHANEALLSPLPDNKRLPVSDNANSSLEDSVCARNVAVLNSSIDKRPVVLLHDLAAVKSEPGATPSSELLTVSDTDSLSDNLLPCFADIFAQMSLFRPLSPISNCQHCGLCDSASGATRVMVLRKRTVTKRQLSTDSDDDVTPAKSSTSGRLSAAAQSTSSESYLAKTAGCRQNSVASAASGQMPKTDDANSKLPPVPMTMQTRGSSRRSCTSAEVTPVSGSKSEISTEVKPLLDSPNKQDVRAEAFSAVPQSVVAVLVRHVRQAVKFWSSKSTAVDAVAAMMNAQPCSSDVIDAILQVLYNLSTDLVAHWYSRCLMEDCIDDTPWLTDSERKLLDILMASSLHFETVIEEFLKRIESTLSVVPDGNPHVIIQRPALCRVFTEICRNQGNMARVRTLVFDTLKQRRTALHCMLLSVAATWPQVLSKSDVSLQPVLSVAEYIFCTQCMPKAKAKKKRHRQMVFCMNKLCGWQTPVLSADELAQTLVHMLKLHINVTRQMSQPPVAGILDYVELGLELLSVYSEWSWTRRQLDDVFLPMIARLSTLSSARQPSASDDGDVAVARVMLGIIGSLLCHCPSELEVDDYTDMFLMQLSAFLKNKHVGIDVQLSALRSLLACVRVLAACHIDACINWLECYSGEFEPVTQRRLHIFYRTIASAS